MRLRWALLSLGALSLSLAGCPEPDSASSVSAEIPLRVTIDLSLGKENPGFTLSRSESRALRKKIGELDENKGTAPPRFEGKSGYQGLVLVEVGRGDGRKEYRIKHGWVVMQDGLHSPKGYADPGRSLEIWVAQKAARVVEARVYDDLLRELESR